MTAPTTPASRLVGANIRLLRRLHGWTQSTLGGRLGEIQTAAWSTQIVSAAENGLRAWSAAELVAVAEVFGVSVGYLFEPVGCPTCGQKLPGEGLAR